MAIVGWQAIWEAAKQLDTDLSGLSWNGFNIAGDRKSIEEVQRLMHLEERLQWFEKGYIELTHTLSDVLTQSNEEKRKKVAAIVAWMRKRAEPVTGDGDYDDAWRGGVKDMAAEIEANEADKCGHAKED